MCSQARLCCKARTSNPAPEFRVRITAGGAQWGDTVFIEHPLCASTTLSALCLSNVVVTRGCEVSVATALWVQAYLCERPHSQGHTRVWLHSSAFYSATLSPGTDTSSPGRQAAAAAGCSPGSWLRKVLNIRCFSSLPASRISGLRAGIARRLVPSGAFDVLPSALLWGPECLSCPSPPASVTCLGLPASDDSRHTGALFRSHLIERSQLRWGPCGLPLPPVRVSADVGCKLSGAGGPIF